MTNFLWTCSRLINKQWSTNVTDGIFQARKLHSLGFKWEYQHLFTFRKSLHKIYFLTNECKLNTNVFPTTNREKYLIQFEWIDLNHSSFDISNKNNWFSNQIQSKMSFERKSLSVQKWIIRSYISVWAKSVEE